MTPRALFALAVLIAAPVRAQVEIVPRVGVDFEHFGETYRITEDQDTVSTVNDYGTLLGLTVQTPWTAGNRFRLDADVHVGKETRRLRLDFDGTIRRGANTFELDQEGAYRRFDEGGDYSISSDYVQEYLRVGWERRLSDRVRLRLRETIDLTWYQDPDDFNLNTFLHRPQAELRLGLGDFSEARLGYRLGRRSVPDSTSLEYWRHTVDTNVSLLFGWTTALDVSSQLDRRIYDAGSVRESSWDHRADLTFEFGSGDRVTYRLLHENEVIRYDRPDELDFDLNWARTGFQLEVHRNRSLDLTIMPVYAFLTSSTALDEEYTEVGLEVGFDLRVGMHTWISLSDEVGRRDYETGAENTDTPLEITDIADLDALAELLDENVFSDYLYNRLTLLVTSDVATGVSINLFANWQPENHHVKRHDTDTRIVSGGIEYRF